MCFWVRGGYWRLLTPMSLTSRKKKKKENVKVNIMKDVKPSSLFG